MPVTETATMCASMLNSSFGRAPESTSFLATAPSDKPKFSFVFDAGIAAGAGAGAGADAAADADADADAGAGAGAGAGADADGAAAGVVAVAAGAGKRRADSRSKHASRAAGSATVRHANMGVSGGSDAGYAAAQSKPASAAGHSP